MTAQRMLAAGVGLWLAGTLWAAAETVTDVRIAALGDVPVDESVARSYLAVKPGSELDRNAVAGDVRALIASGRFYDVSVDYKPEQGGVALIYRLRPKLKLVEPVKVVGGKELGESRVREILGLNAGDYVDKPTVEARAVKLRQEYRERLYGEVAVLTEVAVTDRSQGLATVTVTVTEGRQRSLRKVLFPGREHVEYGVLRAAMDIPAWYNPIGWFRKTPYDQADVNAGCERVAAIYKDRGYLDVVVGEPEIVNPGEGKLVLSIPIKEGLLYTLGRSSIANNKTFTTPDLERAAAVPSGDVAAMGTITRSADAIRDYYESRGYMHTLVVPELDTRGSSGVVDVRFVVAEGRETYVDDVIIRGNSTTRDKVIRRELLVYPEEKYDGVKVRKSESRLRNLGYFSRVTAYDEPTDASNRCDLVFDVEEQRTGAFTAGAGFSSIDKLIGFAEVSQGNFDIRGWPFLGGGQKIKLRGEFGQTREAYTLSFVEPWFMDRKLSLGVDLYSQRINDRDYDVLRQGGALSLGVPLAGPNRLDLKYRLEQVETRNADDTNAYVVIDGDERKEFYFEEPRRTDSSISATLSHDTRDNFFVPTRGLRTYATSTLMGGPVGFDTELYDLEAGASYYVPVWRRHVLSLRARAEVVDSYGGTDEVPLSERLFMGGSRTVRGFRYRWVGPKAERADGSDTVRPVGGQSLALANAEYSIPLVSKIRFATFCDAGNAWLDPYHFDMDTLAVGAGLGVRFDVPGFPMRFDYAWPVQKDDPRSRTERFSFWIGYGF